MRRTFTDRDLTERQSEKDSRIMGLRRDRSPHHQIQTKWILYSCLEGFMDAGMNLIMVKLAFQKV